MFTLRRLDKDYNGSLPGTSLDQVYEIVQAKKARIQFNPIQYGVPPYTFFLCCIKTVCNREMKLSDFYLVSTY